ncbi:hypothetical protein CRM22_006772 [Opisthorchis felineus]|uniref:DDB1- and CUL4-associated factor 12 beta-propeller domain-containing protein n=1 Tax=Opisthorchis felineus TaxID=147828 RepID=A0A4S2LRP4_OPIFE|nr:hypothetical protein CRM22_006772 [Opisthorchis felineus]
MGGPPIKRPRRDERRTVPILKRLQSRELGSQTKLSVADIPEVPFRLPSAWKKRSVDPGARNKIFASQWITSNHVVYGTKCNRLVLYDTSSDSSLEIPLISSGTREFFGRSSCGIHAIQANPSKSLLATGGADVNNIGVYALSELSPLWLLKDCHTDWVFDLRWLDDTYLASCSRDSSLALWRIPMDSDNLHLGSPSSSVHSQQTVHTPFIDRPVSHAISSIPDDRYRALEYLPPLNLLTVVSMSRRLYLYDAIRMGSDKKTKPIFTLALRDAYQEAVALRRWPSEPHCVALATHHCVILFDIRCSDPISASGCCIHPPLAVSGVRSLNFSGDVLSYGSSNGQVHFYDLRGSQHLPTHLEIGPGWVKPNVCVNDESSTPTPISGASMSDTSWFSRISSSSGWRTPISNPPPPTSALTPELLIHGASSFPIRSNNIRIRLDRRQQRLYGLRSRLFPSLMYSLATLHSSVSNDPDTRQQQRDYAPLAGSSRRRQLPFSETLDRIADPIPTPADDSESESGDDVDEVEEPPDHSNDSDEEDGEDEVSMEPTNWRLPSADFRSQASAVNIPLIDLLSNLPSDSSLSAHRRLVAIYTHEYDPSGTRLFTAGGPIASTYHGNVAALWE